VRRAWLAVVVVTTALMTMGGCGRPPGVDGKLVDDWSAFPKAEIPVPAEHACYRPPGIDRSTLGKVQPTFDCGGGTVETVHVGRFGGADAAGGDIPAVDSAGMRAAYHDCDQQAAHFVGADWRTGRLGLLVTLPLPDYWAAGARWYRCDLIAYVDPALRMPATLTESLRGTLAGPGPYAWGCVNFADDPTGRATQVDCGQPHNGEFAGIFDGPDGSDPLRDAVALADGCARVIGAFVGTDAATVKKRVSFSLSTYGLDAWQQGNRGNRCFLRFKSAPVTRSTRGAGAGGLPQS
jgi:hypothetical protein